MEKIEVYVNNEKVLVNENTTLLDLSKKYQSDFKYDIILARVDGEYVELSSKVRNGEKIEFFDLLEREANRVYLNGLILLMNYTFKKKFSGFLKVNHSLDKGLYITTDVSLNQTLLLELEKVMMEIVNQKLPIQKLTISRRNAISYYESVGKYEKEENIKYNTNTYLTMYQLDDYYDYYYSAMPISTEVLKYFKFSFIDEHSFVLTFPTIYMTDAIKAYEHRENIFSLFAEIKAWAKKLGLVYASDLNHSVSSGDIQNIMMIDEMEKNNKILDVARNIAEQSNVKIVLIAGPSSSGKTTTTNKLCLALRSFGKSPKMISMDNFFVERDENPLDAKGNPDYECLEAIDFSLFNQTIEDLSNFKDVVMPEFNFVLGKKEFKNHMQLSENDILLIEGIHAMNPKILSNIDSSKKVRIYLSALSELNVDRDVRISTTDNRLLRRIVRDYRTRGNSVEETIKTWSKVREGEEKYIFPYQDMADYTINTAMLYEIGVLKVFVEPLLYSVDVNSLYYGEAKRLLNFLRLFLPISSENIPTDSILREFVGGGCFKI